MLASLIFLWCVEVLAWLCVMVCCLLYCYSWFRFHQLSETERKNLYNEYGLI